MSKIFGYYKDNVDFAWYDSSNVLYTECVDTDNAKKTLKVVFSNGTQYRYDDVPVMDYLVFREDASQGKALNRIIKGKNFPYEKLENVDTGLLKEELDLRVKGGLFIKNDESGFTIANNIGETLYHKDNKLDDDTLDIIVNILKSINILFKLII